MMYKGFSASGKRDNGILHRSSVTAADKLTDFGDDDVTIADQATGGALAFNTAYYATAIPGNNWGNCKVNSNIDTVTTANDSNNTHAIAATIAQCEDAEHYDLFCSTDAAPKWVGRITEAQRLAGGRILAVGGTIVGDDASDIAGKIRTALAADDDIDAFFTVSGANAEVILTAKTKAANDGTMNISIADGTCDGITTDTSSDNTTAGVAPVQQVETATIVGTVTPGTAQVETATIVGTITGDGNATITVTANGMTGSPKAISVSVDNGTAQVETATVVGSVTGDGNARCVVTAAGMVGSPKNVDFAVVGGVAQVETNTVVGTISGSGNAAVVVTASGMTNSPKTVNVPVLTATAQVETATVVGTITASGNADCIVTAAGMDNSPVTFNVAVLENDTAADVAGKIRTAMASVTEVNSFFTISGAGAEVILTAKAAAANDTTMNIGVTNDTCAGLTPALTSADTTAGVATSDDASAVATKIRTALGADTDVSAFFTVGGTAANVVLTAITKAANDATMNFSIDNGTCTGLTTSATSTNTTAGVAFDTAADVAGKARTALGADADVSAFFTISGANENIILTAKAAAANDTTINMNIDNLTCTGLTAAPTSTDTTAGVAPDDASAVAGKVRTALTADTDVSAFFTVSGTGADVVLTAITAAANDATMNIAFDNDTCVGLTPDATSADTTAGVAPGDGNATITVTANGMTGSPKAISVAVVAGDTASVVAGKVRTALAADADVAAMFTVSGSDAEVILTAITAAANDATLNVASDNGTCTGLTAQASSADTTAGNAGTLQVETATVVGDISTSGNATVVVTAAGLTGSPITVPVAVSNEKDEGVIVIGAVGTGIQTSNDVFAQNNAYTPNDASIVAIDCTGSNNAHVLLKSVVTDLRSAPTLKVIPFTQNKESTTDWHQGALQTIPLLGGAGQSLQQELVFELTEGSEGMKLLIDDITGQGHAVTAYVELS